MRCITSSLSTSERLLIKIDTQIFNDEIKEEYFLYLLRFTNERKFFLWKVFDHWHKSWWKTLAEMNNYWMVYIDLDKLSGNSISCHENSLSNITNKLKICEN